MRRNWIKLYVDQCLRGSMFDELRDPAERFVFFGILLLAGDSPIDGKVCLTAELGYNDEQIAALLKIDAGLMRRTKSKMEAADKIRVAKNNIIEVVNWAKYQSEYRRQLPHRDQDFVRRRDEIKRLDGYICQKCLKHESELRVPLCVHHIDNDTDNNADDNLITLCMTCHSRLLKKASHPTKGPEREREAEEFKKKVQERSSTEQCGLDRDRDRDRDKKEKKEKSDGRSGPLSEPDIDEKFKEFWEAYPREGRLARKESRLRFGAIVKRGELADLIKGFHGYTDYLKHQKVKNRFEQRPMYAKTFLNGRWSEFVGFKYEAQL